MPRNRGIEVEVEVHFDDRVFVVKGRYEPGTAHVYYLRNGDPGYPGDPPELEIEKVTDKSSGMDVTEAYCQVDAFVDACYEAVGEHLADQDDPRDDHRNED